MRRSILEEAAGKVEVAPLTVEQYEHMIETEILPEGAPIELIDGLLVRKDRAKAGGDPMTVGAAHQLVMNRIAQLAALFEGHGCFLALQGPIRIPPDQEPEPDASIVRGRPDDYSKQHPGPRDVPCVIEVSDSSLERDRTTKQRIYARASIPQYLIVNLVERCVELMCSPDSRKGTYRKVYRLGPGQTVGILVGPSKYLRKIVVEDLLPR